MQLRAKIAEYLAFGAEYVWVVDPEICTGEIHNAQSQIHRVSDGLFRAGPSELDVHPYLISPSQEMNLRIETELH